MSDVKKDIQNINTQLGKLKLMIEIVEQLESRDKYTTSEKVQNVGMKEIEQLSKNFILTIKQIKSGLDDFIVKYGNKTYLDFIKSVNTQLTEFKTTFVTKINGYKDMTNNRNKRRLKLILPESTDIELDEIIQTGKTTEVMKEYLLSENVSDIVSCIEDRHSSILKLEKSVLEIHELFKDMAFLVDVQSDTLIVIDKNIDDALDNTNAGEKSLIAATKYQKKSRKGQCCIMFIFLIILIIIFVPIFVIKPSL